MAKIPAFAELGRSAKGGLLMDLFCSHNIVVYLVLSFDTSDSLPNFPCRRSRWWKGGCLPVQHLSVSIEQDL